jgi:hypothetical protein
MADTAEKAQAKPRKKLAEFLESTPPYVTEEISDLCEVCGANWVIARPDIQLHCSSKACEGLRFFNCVTDRVYMQALKGGRDFFLEYVCRNCRETRKTYALVGAQEGDHAFGILMKYGESPQFGPPVPSRVISLIGPDRDLFLRGRRAENHGLGVGAFAYYRRVVENQKGRIITEMGKVAQKLRPRADVLTQFEKAAKETQFSKAIEEIKAAIPDGLLIDGQNPLTLLHSALSEGIHAQTDEECLQLAQDIRIVLTELADRISQALKDEAELKQAVGRLLSRRAGGPPGDARGTETK